MSAKLSIAIPLTLLWGGCISEPTSGDPQNTSSTEQAVSFSAYGACTRDAPDWAGDNALDCAIARANQNGADYCLNNHYGNAFVEEGLSCQGTPTGDTC